MALADGLLVSGRNELVVVDHHCVGTGVESRGRDP